MAATPKVGVPTEPMSLSYPGILEQHHADQGNDIHFSKTLKQGYATHGPKVIREAALWPRKGTDFQETIAVFER